MVDLDALSREIAATSDAWVVPGVSGVTPDGRVWRYTGRSWLDEDDLPASECEGDDDAGRFIASETHGIRPNLANLVTVNSLLGERFISDRRFGSDIGDYHWCGPIDAKGNGEIGPTRTHAICRAWIAANKGEK